VAVRSANAWVSRVVPKSKRTAALEAQAVADFKTAQPPCLTCADSADDGDFGAYRA